MILSGIALHSIPRGWGGGGGSTPDADRSRVIGPPEPCAPLQANLFCFSAARDPIRAC